MSRLKSNPKATLESAAIRYLSFRPRFCVEVEAHLLTKAVDLNITDPVTLIDQIIDSLKRSGFLDDEALLERYIKTRLVDKVRGPYWIRAKLSHLGLSSGLIQEALAKFAPTSLQVETLKNFLSKRGALDQKERIKLTRRLLGRGFSHQIIARAIDGEAFSE